MANRGLGLANWRVLRDDECPGPGDIAAYRLVGGGPGASGHSGVITSAGNISAHRVGVYQVTGQFENEPATVYRRYTGN